jgi:hypothetical protein
MGIVELFALAVGVVALLAWGAAEGLWAYRRRSTVRSETGASGRYESDQD